MAHRLFALCSLFWVFTGCADEPAEVESPAPVENESLGTLSDGSEITPDEAIRQADQLMVHDRVEEAEKILRDAIVQSPDDEYLHFKLANLLAYDGRVLEAIDNLQKRISETNDQTARLNMLVSAGSFSKQLAEDGPTVTRSRGMMQVRPPRPNDDEDAFVKKHLALALDCLKQAHDLSPDDDQIAQLLSEALSLDGKLEPAIELWSKQLSKNPAHRTAIIKLADLRFRAGQPEAAVKLLEKALDRRSNDAEMIEMLVKHFQGANDKDAMDYWQKRHAFYSNMPGFVSIEYNEENQARLDSLKSAERIEALLKDDSHLSSELLAIFCWTHPHNDLEDRAFVELGDRGESKLLQGLLREHVSTCTIRGAARQLARLKSPGLFDQLLTLLPNDRRGVGFDMDIANALDILGDARAVPALISVLAPEETVEQSPATFLYEDVNGARRRAAIALGAFDTKASRKALESGLKNPQIEIASAAGLYRLTANPQHLSVVEAAIEENSFAAWFALSRLSAKLPGETIGGMLSRVEKRLEEDRRSSDQSETE